MTAPRQHLSVFAKAPRPGFAKTRLVPALGEQGSADLAHKLLTHTLATANALPRARIQQLELRVTADPGDTFFGTWATENNRDGRWQVSEQQGADLGARMHHALSDALKENNRAIIIGTDAPALSTATIEKAFAALAEHDAVFVPAFDGGYALVGLRAPIAQIFSQVPWSTSSVMAVTRQRLKHLKKSWLELPGVHDIDEPADLEHLPSGWLTTQRPEIESTVADHLNHQTHKE